MIRFKKASLSDWSKEQLTLKKEKKERKKINIKREREEAEEAFAERTEPRVRLTKSCNIFLSIISPILDTSDNPLHLRAGNHPV